MAQKLVFAVIGLHALIAAASADAEQRLIRISEETTHITQPLDADGYVDYVAAMNERAAGGATPENNFEVILRRVAGPVRPVRIDAEYREQYNRRIGIPVLPEGADYFATYAEFLQVRKLQLKRQRELLEAAVPLRRRPWKSIDHPLVAEWLESVDHHLDAIVAGSKRSAYYAPYIFIPDDSEFEPRTTVVLLPSTEEQKNLSHTLCMRAMLRVANGRLDDAWNDLQAIHRMSRHICSSAMAIEFLVGAALETQALVGEAQVLRSSELTDAQAERCLSDLKRLPALPRVAEMIDTFERHAALDTLQTIARHGTGNLYEILAVYLEDDEDQRAAAGDAPVLAPDWNEALKVANGGFDRLTAAVKIDPVQRRGELRAIASNVLELEAKLGDPRKALSKMVQQNSRDQGVAMGELIIMLMVPDTLYVEEVTAGADARLEIMRLAFAAEVYRRQQGRYPKRLSELVPARVSEVPRDPFSGDPLRYEMRDRGFVVYSIGPNGTDDGGRGYADRGDRDVDWDDIVVRVGRD